MQNNALSVQISSFFTSIEVLFLLCFINRHFQIVTDEEKSDADRSYDELQNDQLLGSGLRNSIGYGGDKGNGGGDKHKQWIYTKLIQLIQLTF